MNGVFSAATTMVSVAGSNPTKFTMYFVEHRLAKYNQRKPQFGERNGTDRDQMQLSCSASLPSRRAKTPLLTLLIGLHASAIDVQQISTLCACELRFPHVLPHRQGHHIGEWSIDPDGKRKFVIEALQLQASRTAMLL